MLSGILGVERRCIVQQPPGASTLHARHAQTRCAAVPSPSPQQMGHLRAGVERVVQHFLVGPHAETKLALLPHLAHLAAFAGRRDTADVLLPSLLTFFNSQSWQVGGAVGMDMARGLAALLVY